MAVYGVRPEVGHVLDERYLLERVLGEGGMGVVFGARHLELDELVAVKVLHASAGVDEEQLERFLREARLAAKIKNEHVVRVLDVARGRGSTPPFIVMEYLEGIDLADLVQARGPLSPTEAVDFVLQACEAVAEAHQLGIVHRDLKPSNLLLTRRSDGAPLLKVLDFGISKAHDAEDSKLTTTRAVFGSPAYMSPEQIRSAKHVDQRADVWALAVVLFELLTGRLPFEGDNAGAVLAAVSADPPLPLGRYADVPSGLPEAIEKCLVKDRDRRVGSIAEMATTLAPFASPAGLVSVETIRRIASTPRPSQLPSGRRSGSSPALEALETTVHQLTPPPRVIPIPSRRPSDPHAVGRTDRAIVVASQRTLSSRTPLLAALAVGIIGVVLIAATWAVQQTRAKADSSTVPVTSRPTASAAVASEQPVLAAPRPSAASPQPGASSLPSPVVSAVASHTERSARPPPPRSYGFVPRATSTPTTPPAATPPPVPTPPPAPTKPNGHVDTDSRQ